MILCWQKRCYVGPISFEQGLQLLLRLSFVMNGPPFSDLNNRSRVQPTFDEDLLADFAFGKMSIGSFKDWQASRALPSWSLVENRPTHCIVKSCKRKLLLSSIRRGSKD
jgi:hypothetical protein